MKLLEEIIGDNLHDFEFGNEFLDKTLKAQFMMRKIDKLDVIKINNFCSAKKKRRRNKKPQTRRKNLENTYLMKNYHPKYMRNS